MNLSTTTKVEFSGHLDLSEVELRALDALVGYGVDNFLRVFYANLGQHYLKPHEAGVRLLFGTIGRGVPQQLARIEAARELLATGVIKAKDRA